MIERARLGRGLALTTLIGLLAGCPATSSAVPETIARAHTSSPSPVADPSRTPDGSLTVVHPALQSPVPFVPGADDGNGTGTDTDPSTTATGTGGADAGGTFTLGPNTTATTAPTSSPLFHFGEGAYGGPFTMPNGPTIMRVTFKAATSGAPFVLYLDTADAVTKNLLVDAHGSIHTTFAYPKLGGRWAFYVQNFSSANTWSVDVWGPSPSPSPSSSPAASPTASASPSPSPSPSPTATAKPTPSPTPTDDGTDEDAP